MTGRPTFATCSLPTHVLAEVARVAESAALASVVDGSRLRDVIFCAQKCAHSFLNVVGTG